MTPICDHSFQFKTSSLMEGAQVYEFAWGYGRVCTQLTTPHAVTGCLTSVYVVISDGPERTNAEK